MPGNPEDPLIKVPLGLSAKEGPPMKALLKRITRRLGVMHSGQRKLDWLVDLKLLGRATLQVEEDEFVLCLRIPPPAQGDLVGYPEVRGPSPIAEGAASMASSARGSVDADPTAIDPSPALEGECQGNEAARPHESLTSALDTLSHELGQVHGHAANDDVAGTGSADRSCQREGEPGSPDSAGRSGGMVPRQAAQPSDVPTGAPGSDGAGVVAEARDSQGPAEKPSAPAAVRHDIGPSLGDALAYLVSDLDSPDSGGTDDAPEPQGEADPAGVEESELASADDASARQVALPVTSRTVDRLEPGAPEQLPVAEALEGVRRSADFVREVQDVMQLSTDVVQDMKKLEDATGLKSGPTRYFIAAREPAFSPVVDGTPVQFAADAVRTNVGDDQEIVAVLRLVRPRGHFDDFKARIVSAEGTGVPDGVTTLGRHDIRFADLLDYQRGVLLILRGAGHEFHVSLKEKISTGTLERRPALVTRLDAWDELRARAIEMLQAVGSPGGGGAPESGVDGLVEGEVGDLFAGDGSGDDLKAA